ncbi:MAG: hypothetical protein EPN88_01390 [Bacteroidetes bacterium]|nr:MAG: hypothetical protein EPN88_01390 [Bacteroidota bacterium]
MKKAILIVLVVIIVIGIILYILWQKTMSSGTQEPEVTPVPTTVLPTVSDNVKAELTVSPGKKDVSLKIEGFAAETESIEYELRYMTGAGLPRGVNGKITLNGEKEIARNNITLGSCSTGGKCTYDEGVTSIDVTLKFNAATGSSIYQKTFPL